jgi:hypothetical protein
VVHERRGTRLRLFVIPLVIGFGAGTKVIPQSDPQPTDADARRKEKLTTTAADVNGRGIADHGLIWDFGARRAKLAPYTIEIDKITRG